MTVLGRFDSLWKAARMRRVLGQSGDSREFTIREQPDGRYPDEPFVLLAGDPMGTDVPVDRDGWPGLDVGPQDVHGSDAA